MNFFWSIHNFITYIFYKKLIYIFLMLVFFINPIISVFILCIYIIFSHLNFNAMQYLFFLFAYIPSFNSYFNYKHKIIYVLILFTISYNYCTYFVFKYLKDYNSVLIFDCFSFSLVYCNYVINEFLFVYKVYVNLYITVNHDS